MGLNCHLLLMFSIGFLSGCQSWRSHSEPLDRIIAEKRPEKVRVVKNDNRRQVLLHPVVTGDSLQRLEPDRARVQ